MTVDIRCYCHRYCLMEALPSVPMLVMSIPNRQMPLMFAEWACQIVGSVVDSDHQACADEVTVEFVVMVWLVTLPVEVTFVNVATFGVVAVTFVAIIEEMVLDTEDCYPFVELGIAAVGTVVSMV